MTIQPDRKQSVVGAGRARDLSNVDVHSRARPAPTESQQQEIVNLANAYIRESIEKSPVIETRGSLVSAKTVGAGHARDLMHGDVHSRARPAPTESQQQEIVNLANAYIRESIEKSPVIETRGSLVSAKTVGAGHARDLMHGDVHSRARPAPTESQQQEIVNLANAYIRESIEKSPVIETRGSLVSAKTVGAGHARDLSNVDVHSRARPAPTESQQQEIVNLANAIIRESIEQSPVIETRLGEVLEEIKKGIGETWADYPVLGATRNGLAAAKTVGAGRARDMSHA